MATLTVGRICMKTAGREAGKYCVILKKMDENFFLITGPKVLTGVKRRKCNIDHLEPTEYLIKIEAEASDKKVIDVLDKEGLLKKLGLKKPSPEIVKGPEMKGKKVKKEKSKEIKKEKKKPEGKTITISLPRLGRKKEKPKEKKKVTKKVKSTKKKASKPKKPAKKK